MYYVYSLKCKGGYYLGCTNDLKDRVRRHKKGHIPATANRLPLKLDFYFAIEDQYKAFEFEKYLKSGSGRAFINRHILQPNFTMETMAKIAKALGVAIENLLK